MLKTRLTLAFLALAGLTQAKVVTQDLEYMDGKTTCQGFLAYDDAKAKAPGLLIAHQWMGLSDYEKGRAKQLAELGYTVLAADIYGKGVRPSNPKDAGAEVGKYKGDRALIRSRMTAALKALKAQKNVEAKNVAALGYCFGGLAALELARAKAPLKGVVSFHGNLDSPSPADNRGIKAKVLILHGADDPYVPKKDIEAFESELKAGKVDYQIVSYSGAVHAFSQPGAGKDNSKGAAYNKKADQRSFVALKDFLTEIFN